MICGGLYPVVAAGVAWESEIVWDRFPTPPGLNGLNTMLTGRTEGTDWPSNEAGLKLQLFTAAEATLASEEDHATHPDFERCRSYLDSP